MTNQDNNNSNDFDQNDDFYSLRDDFFNQNNINQDDSEELEENEEISLFDLEDEESDLDEDLNLENKEYLDGVEDEEEVEEKQEELVEKIIEDMIEKEEEKEDVRPEKIREEKNNNFIDDRKQDNQKIEETEENDVIKVSRSKMILIKKLLENARECHERTVELVSTLIKEEDSENKVQIKQPEIKIPQAREDELTISKIIEGVFDGQKMIGPDGKQYSMPANYASKSKLVEGDIMKLTITGNGTFVYKQINPVERSREVGTLGKDEEGNFVAILGNRRWNILPASVTYFKGEVGDEIVFLIPVSGDSTWAAVENIVKKF